MEEKKPYEPQALHYHSARKAIDEIEKLKLEPHAEHYRLWYAVASDEDPKLTQEIRQIRGQQVILNEDVCSYLNSKYFPTPAQEISAGTYEAKELLATVTRLVTQFTGDTAEYNAKIDQQTNRLEKSSENPDVGNLLNEIVAQLNEIRSSGKNFTGKMLESRQEIDTLRKNLEKATAESRMDFLTGVHNRRAFDEMISDYAQQAEKQLKDLCLLMIDIDHFKKFNDTYGHQMGDEVIKVVARALTETLRGSDVVARFGGEEFAVLLPGTPTNGALVVAENIRKTIAGKRLKRRDSDGDMGQITVSIGVARYRVGEGDTVPFLIKRADEALYSAKRAGRNRVVADL